MFGNVILSHSILFPSHREDASHPMSTEQFPKEMVIIYKKGKGLKEYGKKVADDQ